MPERDIFYFWILVFYFFERKGTAYCIKGSSQCTAQNQHSPNSSSLQWYRALKAETMSQTDNDLSDTALAAAAAAAAHIWIDSAMREGVFSLHKVPVSKKKTVHIWIQLSPSLVTKINESQDQALCHFSSHFLLMINNQIQSQLVMLYIWLESHTHGWISPYDIWPLHP